MELLLSIVGATIALASAAFAFHQARAAKESLRITLVSKLFSTFDIASQITIAQPELLYSVHGLDKSVSRDEASNIAYLSMLMDAFQNFYGEKYNGDFAKMASDFKVKSTFLNKILAVSENRIRWPMLKRLYYGGFDESFINAIESLMEHENKSQAI